VLLPLSAILVTYGWDGLMRTTRYAETDIWARRIAAFAGPAFLALAGVIVIARNVLFLRGRRAGAAPSAQEELPDGE